LSYKTVCYSICNLFLLVNLFINILFTGNCQFKRVVQHYHTVLCTVLSGFDSRSTVGMVLPKQGVASGSALSSWMDVNLGICLLAFYI